MTKTYDQTPQIDFQVRTKAELESYSAELSRQFVAMNTDGRLHWIDQDGAYHVTSQKANVASVDPGAGDDINDGYYPLSIWINQTNSKAFLCLDSTAGDADWLEIKDTAGALLASAFGSNSILKSDTNGNPVSLPVEEDRIIGRQSGGVISSLTGAQVAAIINAFVKSTDTAADVKMMQGGASVRDVFDDYLGHGWVSGHDTYQDNGDGTVTINAGQGYLRSSQDTTAAINKYDVPGNTLTLDDNATNWIYQDYNSGSPVLASSSNPASVRGRQDINIIKVVDREGTDLRQVDSDNGWKAFHSIVSQRWFDEAIGQGYRSALRLSGASIATKGTRNIYISAGVFWAGSFRSESLEIDTSVGDTATQWYGNTSVGFTSASITQTNNTQYFNGTSLVSLTANQWTIRWEWLLSSGDQLHQMIGTGQYVSEALARSAAETIPTDIPPRLARFGTFVGAKIVQEGSSSVIDLPRWGNVFSASGTIAHDATLDKNFAPEYQHVRSNPEAGETGTKVLESDYFTGGTKVFDVSPRPIANIGLDTELTGINAPFNCTSDYYFYTISDAGVLYKMDRFSGDVISSGTVHTTYVPIVCDDDDTVLLLLSSGVRVVDTRTYQYNDVASALGSGLWTARKYNSQYFTVNSSDTLMIVDPDYTLASSVVIADVVNRVWSHDIDDTYLYGVDIDPSAGSFFVRKWDRTTGALVTSGSSFSAHSSAAYSVGLFLIDDFLYLVYQSTSPQNRVRVINPSTMATIYDGADYVNGGYSSLCSGGFLFDTRWDGVRTNVNTSILPALTLTGPRAADFSDSDSFRFKQKSTGHYYSDQDFMRAASLVKEMYPLLNPSTRLVQQVSVPDPDYETVRLSDRNGIINFQATCGQGYRLVIPDAIAAIDCFEFSVRLAPGTAAGIIGVYDDDGTGAPGTSLFSIADDPLDTDDVLAKIRISDGTYFVEDSVLSK